MIEWGVDTFVGWPRKDHSRFVKKIDSQVRMYNIEEYADVANVWQVRFGGKMKGWKSSFGYRCRQRYQTAIAKKLAADRPCICKHASSSEAAHEKR